MNSNSESGPLYTPPPDWHGKIGRTAAESEPHWPDPTGPAAGTPRCRRDGPGRHWLWPPVLLRRHRPDTEYGPIGSGRTAIQLVLHDGAVLADAGLALDRTQSSLGRDAGNLALGQRLSTHDRCGDAAGGHDRGDPATGWLLDSGGGQVAPHPGAGVVAGRAVHELAAGPRVRSVLRLLAGRDRSVPAPNSVATTSSSIRRGRPRRVTICRPTSSTRPS